MTAERTPDARVEAERRWAKFDTPDSRTYTPDAVRAYMRGAFVAGAEWALAVECDGLTERVAEVLDAHRLAPIDEHQDWTCRCGEVIAYAGLHLDLRPLIIAHQAAAVVAAIYGTRP